MNFYLVKTSNFILKNGRFLSTNCQKTRKKVVFHGKTVKMYTKMFIINEILD